MRGYSEHGNLAVWFIRLAMPTADAQCSFRRLVAGLLLTLERLDGCRESRFGACGCVRVNYVTGCCPIELLGQLAKFSLALLIILGGDGFANLAKLRSDTGFHCTVAEAANRILPHTFFGAGCVGHSK